MTTVIHAERVELVLTPLTPIHVGCGVDFVPMGYVIDDGFLYAFDPARVPVTESDRAALNAAVRRRGSDAILALHRFFFERSDWCKGAARNVVAVAAGVAEQYRERIGEVAQFETGGREVVNRLAIERTAHHPHSGIAYLPGSSLKGAMRTAWLDRKNGGRPRWGNESAQELEKRLLGGGAFQTDPFRFVSVADAVGDDVVSRVYFSAKHEKRAVHHKGQEVGARGLTARRECIAPAQRAALRCTLAIDGFDSRHKPGDTPSPDARIASWRALADACNGYYRPRLEKELELLEGRHFVAPDWAQRMRALLRALAPFLDAGDATLLRVGRHSGAECVTLDGVREIRIRQDAGKEARSGSESTTVWLAAEVEHDRSGLQPFGWLLLHRAGVDIPVMRDWCDSQPRIDLSAARAKVEEARAQAQVRMEEQAASEARQRVEQARVAEAAAREELRLQALSPQGREVEALRSALLAHIAVRRQPVSGRLYQLARRVIACAEEGNWPATDRAALADLLRTLLPEKVDLGGKAKEIRQAAARLAGDA